MTRRIRSPLRVAFAVGVLPLLLGTTAMSDDLLMSYADIQARHQDGLLRLPGVTGTGVGRSARDPNALVIRIYVRPGTPATERAALPSSLDGAPVEIIESEPASKQ